jgi:hypothetical protein
MFVAPSLEGCRRNAGSEPPVGSCSQVKHTRLYQVNISPKKECAGSLLARFARVFIVTTFHHPLAVRFADRTRRAGCCTCFLAASGTPLPNVLLEKC